MVDRYANAQDGRWMEHYVCLLSWIADKITGLLRLNFADTLTAIGGRQCEPGPSCGKESVSAHDR